MTSLIRSSTSVYNRYKVLPIVLIFAIKGFSDNTTKEEFTTNKRQYLLKISSKFWAKECSLSSIASINEHIIQSPTDESVVLGYFLISGSLSLMLLEHKSNPTVQLIYNITMQIFLREGNGKASKKIVTDQILEDTKRQLEKILEEDTTQEPDIKKIKHPLYSICVTAWQKQGMEKHIR
ncbi:hypothetical protein BDF21DRAFT_432736 [Thamnidium elegans]|nr:hypothetical protein BDF21DRAFT_432736 [Thamnidium elegans]